MKNTFQRPPYLPTLMLVSGSIFLITTLLQLSMKNPVGYMTLIASILMFVNAIWMFSNPVLTFDGETLFVKEALLNQKEIKIASIERIDTSDNRFVDIYRKNDSKVRIRLSGIKSSDKNDFKFLIEEIITLI